MNATADLAAIGPESHQRWQKPLPEAETIRIGRAPRHGWKVAWDCHISREHADLIWKDGELTIRCLGTARNPVEVGGQRGSQFVLGIGETFRIGTTQFLISAPEDEPVGVEEITFDGTIDDSVDAARRLKFVMKLPEIIAHTRSDEELAEQLTALLLEALPHVRAAATIRFESIRHVEEGRRPMIRWDSRTEDPAPFAPSKQLIRSTVHQGKGVLHSFLTGGEGDAQYTMSAGMDWAICTPITTHGPEYWCLYVAGASDDLSSRDTLRADLSFTTLMAQFIGSIRQVRQLEKIQANMSHFFSPKVAELIGRRSGDELAVPRISEISVLFCDVRGFSAMTERAADDLFPLLQRVREALGMMTRNIIKYDGVIADFQGDAALGFWGWPLAPDDGALPACRAALDIDAGFRQALADPKHPLHGMRITMGLAHGRAIAGQIGSEEQVKVGVFGPRVNLGSRLQGLAKQLGVATLMDEVTAAQAREALTPADGRCRFLGRYLPVGISNPVDVSELLPRRSADGEITDEEIAAFEVAVGDFMSGDWQHAREVFETIHHADGPRDFLLRFMDEHNRTPPADWDGIVRLTEK